MKATRFIAPVLILTIFLTGCSLLPLSAEENKYVDNCQIVYDNFEEYVKLQNKFHYAKIDDPRYDWKSWRDTYLVTNVGQASRDNAINSIKSQFSGHNNVSITMRTTVASTTKQLVHLLS